MFIIRKNFKISVLIVFALVSKIFSWNAVGVPGTFNGWTINNCYKKTNLGTVQYWGYTTAVSVGQEFKIQADSWDYNWGSGYWITSYNQRWTIPQGGANAQIQGSPSTYVHFCIKDPPASGNVEVGIMTLSASPVSITSVTDNSKSLSPVSISQPVRVRITLSGSKSSEEKIYVRFTTDNWNSDNFILASASNTTIYTCSIPAQNKLCTIEYYVLTTTLTWSSGNDLDNYPDLMTINYKNNNGQNYKYTVNKVGTKVIDGDPSDWKGVAPSGFNQAQISSNEWIWKDKSNDSRTDPSNPQNYDITETRITFDSNYIFFLFKMRDITSIDEPYIAINVDIDTNYSDTQMNWLGDDSATFLGADYSLSANAHYGEYNLIIHNPISGTTRIERYTNTGNWHSPPNPPYDTAAYISATSNTIEIAINRADIGATGNKLIRFTIASFDNVVGWANDIDTTGNYTTTDALDSISITKYLTNDSDNSKSSWDEDLSDGDIDFWFDIKVLANGKITNRAPNAPNYISPLNNTNLNTNWTILKWNKATDSDTGDAVTSYLLEMNTSSNFEGTILYRINLNSTTTQWQTPLLPEGVKIYWRVQARDRKGILSSSPVWSFITPILTITEPTVPVFTPVIDGEKDTLWGNQMSCTSSQSNKPYNWAPGFYLTNDPEYLYIAWVMNGDPWNETDYNRSAHYGFILETHSDASGKSEDPFLSNPTTKVNWSLKPDFWLASWIKTGMTNFGGIFLYEATTAISWLGSPLSKSDYATKVNKWTEIRLPLKKLGLKLDNLVRILNYFRPAEDKPGVSDTAPFDEPATSDWADTNANISSYFLYKIRYAKIKSWHIPAKEDVYGFGKMRSPLNPSSSDKIKLYIGVNPSDGIDKGIVIFTTNNWATIFSNNLSDKRDSGGFSYYFTEIGNFKRNSNLKYFFKLERNGMITYIYGNNTNSSTTSNYSQAQANAYSLIISNSAPTPPTSIVIAPSFPSINSNLILTASGSYDYDNDNLTYYFEWYKNDVLQTSLSSTDNSAPYNSKVSNIYLSKGDKWYCKIKVKDSFGKFSDYAQSESVYILYNNWLSFSPQEVNKAIVTNNEFIFKDKLNDTREEISSSESGNYDIEYFRIKTDYSNLYFLIKLRQITYIDLPYIAISIDTNRSPISTATNIIGDNSDTTLGSDYYLTPNEHKSDINIIAHTVAINHPEIEYLFSGSSSWSNKDNDIINIFKETSLIELKIPKANLGFSGSKILRISVATFKNSIGYANLKDTTFNLSGSDAIDVITIPAISDTNVLYNDFDFSLNSISEELFDNDIDFWFDIFLESSNLKKNNLPSSPSSPSPTNNAVTNNLRPSFSWALSSDPDANDSVTSYLFELNITTNFDSSVIYRVNLKTNFWRVPDNLPYGYTNYYWRVRARDRWGALSSGNIWKFKVQASAPIVYQPLDNLNLNNFGEYNGIEDADGTVVWHWQAASDINPIVNYYIDIGTSPGIGNILTNQKLTNITSFTMTNLEKGKTYYAQIRAKNSLGLISKTSPPSDGIYVNKRKIDGSDNDWVLGNFQTNKTSLSNGEGIWIDKLNDVRNNITHLDLSQFRLTADKYNLYFYLKFNTSSGFKDGSHFIQIAIDNSGESINRAFIGRLIQTADLYVSGDMPWEYLVKILSGFDTATACDKTYGNWRSGKYSENTNIGFIEVGIPLKWLGGSSKFLNSTIKISVAIFSNNNGNVQAIDGNSTPDALDVISEITQTWNEISDQIIDYSISVSFNSNGDVINFQGNKTSYPASYPQTTSSWRWAQNAIIYNMFVDRFENGNPANDPNDPLRFGGDFQGLINRMDYFKDLNINCLYLSPVMEFNGGCTGYGVNYWWDVEDGFGGDSDFKKFLREARNNYIDVVIDWPGTAVGFSQPIRDEHPAWISVYKSPWGDWPEFCVGMAEVQQYMADLKRFWLAKGVRGFREDYAKFDGNPVEHGHIYWQEVMKKVLKTFPDFYNFGEIFDGAYKISTYVWNGIELKGAFDFPLKYSTLDWMLGYKDSSSFRNDVDNYEATYGNNPIMASFIDNHDVDRVLRTMNWDGWKVRRGFGFTLTHCIPPKIFYGTETGMDGYRIGTDLDNSPNIAPMNWNFNYDQHNFFKHLIKGRRSFPGLRSDKGSRIWKYTSGQWLIYERNYYNDAILVIINQSSSSANAPTGSFTTWANRTWRDWMNWNDYFTTYANGYFTSTINVQGNDVRVLVSREYGGGGFGVATLQGYTKPNAIVAVWDYAQNIVQRIGKADNTGFYKIEHIVCKDNGPETFKVQVWAEGYEMKTITTVTLYDATTTTLNITLNPDFNPPSIPQGLSAAPGDKMIELDWNDNPEEDIDSYKIYKSTSDSGPWTLIDTVLRSAYIDRNVTNGKTYYYKIRAKDRNGNLSGFSSIVKVTPNPIEVTFWLDISESGYNPTKVYLAGNSEKMNFWGIIGKHLEMTEVGNGWYKVSVMLDPRLNIQYKFIIQQGDTLIWENDFSGDYSYYWNRYFSLYDRGDGKLELVHKWNQGGMAKPKKPENIILSPKDKAIEIGWNVLNLPTDISYFTIYKSTNGSSFYQIAKVSPTSGKYLDSGLVNGNTYWYYLTATDIYGQTSENSKTNSAVPTASDTIPPAPVKRISIAVLSTNSVKITWQPNAELDIAGYNVFRSFNSNSGFVKINSSLISASTNPYFIDNNLQYGTNYYYRVQAIDFANNTSSFSETKNCFIVKTEFNIDIGEINPSIVEIIGSPLPFTSQGITLQKINNYTFRLTTGILAETPVYYKYRYNNSITEEDFNTGSRFREITLPKLKTYIINDDWEELPMKPTGVWAFPWNKKVDIFWDALSSSVEDLKGYNIYITTNINEGIFQKYNSEPIVGTSTSITGLLNNVKYYFVIKAVDSGNIQLESPPSDVVYAVPKKSQPVYFKTMNNISDESNPPQSGAFYNYDFKIKIR